MPSTKLQHRIKKLSLKPLSTLFTFYSGWSYYNYNYNFFALVDILIVLIYSCIPPHHTSFRRDGLYYTNHFYAVSLHHALYLKMPRLNCKQPNADYCLLGGDPGVLGQFLQAIPAEEGPQDRAVVVGIGVNIARRVPSTMLAAPLRTLLAMVIFEMHLLAARGP